MVTKPTGNMGQVYRATNAADLQRGDIVGYGDANALYSQVSPGIEGKWHLYETMPGQENVVAGHLIGRRFGILLPEISYAPSVRYDAVGGRWLVEKGAKLPRRRLMFNGYIFVFAWLDSNNHARVKAVPGIQRLACWPDGAVFSLTDKVVNYIRNLEAILTPVEIPADWRSKPRRNGWRKKRLTQGCEAKIEPDLMRALPKAWFHIGDGQWIDGVDALGVLDACGENQSLAKALGLTSQ